MIKTCQQEICYLRIVQTYHEQTNRPANITGVFMKNPNEP